MLILQTSKAKSDCSRHFPLLTISGARMLDVVAKMLPAAATIAVASLSMFNVGYFWKIGLHFLGIVDWNNIVYSFGLAFGLWMVLVLVGLRLVDIFSEPASELSVHRSRRTNKIVMWIGVGIFLIASWNP